MNKRGDFGVGTGGASILVIFVLLCLTTFATLSIVSANADYKLTQRSAQAVTEYYAADLKANELLQQIDTALQSQPAQGTTVERLRGAVSSLPEVTGVEETLNNGAAVHYTVPISDTRELQIVLAVRGEALDWNIESWQTVSTVEWQEDNNVQLWDGGPDGMGLAGLPDELAGLPAEAAE